MRFARERRVVLSNGAGLLKMSKIQKTILQNGIKILTEEMPDAESSSVGVWVIAGSRNESRKTRGISHFIEHMLFKGTARRTALDISKEIESVGGVLNAFTSREYTCFYAKVLNKDIPKAVDLLSDIFINPKFDPAELEKEKMVVLQEIKLVEDTPDDVIHDIFAEKFWKGHPLGWSILGTRDTVSSFTREDVLGYYNTHYRSAGSGRVFITVAGGLSHERIVKLVKRPFSSIAPVDNEAKVERPETASGVSVIRKDLEQAHICMGVPMPGQTHKDRYKVYLLNTIFGGGMSSRLFQEIREKRGLAYSVYSYLNLCKDSGSLTLYAGCSKESFAETAGLMVKELLRLRKGVTAEELKNAKSQLQGSMLLGLETSDGRMSKLARDEIYFARVLSFREISAGIEAVKAKDLKKIAGDYLSAGVIMAVAMGRISARGLPKALKRLM